MTIEPELSERERDILRLVATGASNKEIAQRLVISPNTVKVHLRNIFAKIGVVSRTEATLYAIRAGLVAAPGAPANGPEAPPAQEAPPTPAPAAPAGLAGIWARLGRARWLAAFALLVLVVAGGSLLSRALERGAAPGAVATAAAPTFPPRWQGRAALPTPRSGLAAAVYENRIYAIGGEAAGGVTGATEGYDPLKDVWQALAAKPHPVADVGAALLGEKIYVPGGRLADGQPSALLEVYDPRRNIWEERAPLPAPRSAYALAVFEGRLYLFGGWDGQAIVATVFEYDPAGDAWRERSPLPGARMYAGAAAAAGKIFVSGGFDGKDALTANLAYYPERDANGEDPWEPRSPLPEGRYGMAVTALADVIYLAGGRGPGAAAPVEYLAQSDQWIGFEPPAGAIGWLPAAAGAENFVYVLGGGEGNPPTPQAGVEGYQAIYTIAIPAIQR